MKRILSAIMTLITLAPLQAQNRIGTGPVVEIYRQHCALCHGRDLEGGLGGALIGPLDHATDGTLLTQWITDGNADLGMPAFADVLNAEEIRSLVIYVQEKRLQAERDSAAASVEEDGTYTAGGHRFRIETVATGFSIPWAIAFLPDGGMLITERGGTLRQVRNDIALEPVRGTPEVWARGQGGLLEVALHPDYADNGWIYLGFSESVNGGEGTTAIARGRIIDNAWVDQEWIFRVPLEHHSSRGQHFGTRFVFKDGYLFFSIGDRGERETAQDPSSPNGKVHRIHDDGRIPDDNPFTGSAGAFPSIWTLGNRNIQGMALNPADGALYASEHGPRGGDELNRIERGLNYGWPVITYGMEYSGSPITARTEAPGMEQPLIEWTPSLAVCGMDFYAGEAFPLWQGSLLSGGLSSQQLNRIVLEDGKVVLDEVLLRGIGRIRDVGIGPDGLVYLVLNGPDQIVRLLPAQ